MEPPVGRCVGVVAVVETTVLSLAEAVVDKLPVGAELIKLEESAVFVTVELELPEVPVAELLREADPPEPPEPVMEKGKEYWKIEVSSSQVI